MKYSFQALVLKVEMLAAISEAIWRDCSDSEESHTVIFPIAQLFKYLLLIRSLFPVKMMKNKEEQEQ